MFAVKLNNLAESADGSLSEDPDPDKDKNEEEDEVEEEDEDKSVQESDGDDEDDEKPEAVFKKKSMNKEDNSFKDSNIKNYIDFKPYGLTMDYK